MLIDHVSEYAMFTSRLHDHVRLYSVLLGQPDRFDGEHMAEWNVNGLTVRIHRTPDSPRFAAPNEDHVAFAVKDLERVNAALAGQGIVAEVPPQKYPWGYSMYLRDPDARVIELHQA